MLAESRIHRSDHRTGGGGHASAGQDCEGSSVDENTLTTKVKWEAVWAGVRLPIIAMPGYDIETLLDRHLPVSPDLSLIEIGCAPGSWLAWFHRRYGYSVRGLDYADVACETTRRNMALLEVDAEILHQDFFTFDCEGNQSDIVFSSGFIEHFRDVTPVMERIVGLSRRYVVTIVPNVFGTNGFISKTVRPKVYAEHTQINVPKLESLHAALGMKTLFCDFVGGVRLIMPGANTPFFNTHPRIARAVNLPVRVLNRLSENAQRATRIVPRSAAVCDSLLYIGEKPVR